MGGYPVIPARYFGYVDNGHLHFDITYTDQGGAYIDLTYDAYYGNKPYFTDVCDLITPEPNPSA